MNGTAPGYNSPYDVIGASEGTDIGSLAPDAQSVVLRALAAHLDKITAVVMSNKDAPIEQVEFEVDASLLGGAQSFKLPTGSAIVSYHIENNSGATIQVFASASGAGRQINAIAANTYKVALCPQQTTSIALLSSSPTLTGLLRVVLTTVPLGPSIGSTIGVANTAPSTTSTQTQVVVSTTSILLLAANPARISATIRNLSGQAILVAYGIPATSGQYSDSVAGSSTFIVTNGWKGSIYGICASSGATANVTEYTP
jgi:hypothetical protein